MATFILQIKNVKKQDPLTREVVQHIDVEAHVERSPLMPNEVVDLKSPAAQVMFWIANNMEFIMTQIRSENDGKDNQQNESQAGSKTGTSLGAGGDTTGRENPH